MRTAGQLPSVMVFAVIIIIVIDIEIGYKSDILIVARSINADGYIRNVDQFGLID
jgi:hypothetical protein